MTKQEARRSLKTIRPKLKSLRADLRRLEREEIQCCKAAKKMKPGNGRQKGNSFERDVAKTIVRIFQKAGYNITDEDVYRTPSSGGHRYAKKEDPGDLVISPRLLKLFPCSVECKDQKALELYRFFIPFSLHKSSWPEHQFLAQTVAAAKLKKGLVPMLVFKKHSKVFCAFPSPIMLFPPALDFQYEGERWQLCLFRRYLKKHIALYERMGKMQKEKRTK
jgi:hypothetical protein